MGLVSTRSEASVMSCGLPKAENILKNASSPCSVAKRVVNTGAICRGQVAGLRPVAFNKAYMPLRNAYAQSQFKLADTL